MQALSKNYVKKTSPNKSPTVLLRKRIKAQWQLLLLLLPAIVFYIVFRYVPMYGIVIAFKDFGVWSGINNSPWVGIKHFELFFNSGDFWPLFRNTITLGATSLVVSFPFPIIFAIILNEARNIHFKKLVQTVSYLP